MRNKLLGIITVFVFALLLVSCKNDGEKKSGVTGRVTATEGSGANAIVRIYPAPDVESDASVWSVTAEEDQVGFPYDVKFSFDQRTVSPVMSDTADGDGNFQFESVVGGNYVIVAEKLNQGFSQPRLFSTTGSDVDLGELRLPRVVVYEDEFVLHEDVTWEGGTQYVLRDRNLRIAAGVTLTIQPGAIVLLAGSSSLEIDGTLICRGTPDNYIRFMAADVLSRDPDEWQEIKVDDGANPPEFEYVSFRDGSTALNLQADSGFVRNCYFYRFSGEGILAQAPGQPPAISRCVFDRIGTGVRNTSTSNFLCEHSIFQTCDPSAITLYSMTDCEIYCNWFRDCGGSDTSGSGTRGVIKLDLVTNSEIHNNFFETSWYALQVGSFVDSTTEIHHNVFTRMNTVVNIGVTEDQRGPSNPALNYNCFSSVDRFVVFINCNQHNTHDMDATSNSWGTTSLTQIKSDYIHDRDDDGTCPIVFIPPVMSSCPEILTLSGVKAGICQ